MLVNPFTSPSTTYIREPKITTRVRTVKKKMVILRLLEASAFFTAEQRIRWKLEVLEAELVFLHAAVAEHDDLGASQTLVDELSFAVFAGGDAITQLWAFFVFPMIGAGLGVLAWRQRARCLFLAFPALVTLLSLMLLRLPSATASASTFPC